MKKIIFLSWFYLLLIPQVLAEGFVLIPEDGTIGGKNLKCNFTTGDFEMFCIPAYIKYLINIIVGIAGTVAVIFIMVGGFKYIISGISEDKEAGKETIKHAIIGLIITGLSWIIVTGVISIVTM